MATELRKGEPLDLGVTKTFRRDAWWFGPALTVVFYLGFVVYATFRVFEPIWNPAAGYHVGPYLSPFGTPDLRVVLPAFAYAWIPFPVTPALLILPFPAGFRFTCYYYRKSYYRAFAASPPACAVAAVGAKAVGGKREYQGEKGILAFQNLHRYFLYAAIVIAFLLLYDAFLSLCVDAKIGNCVAGEWHFGLGSVILWLNVVMLAAYTFGCHALRHLAGGKADCFSCTFKERAQYSFWKGVTRLNERHGLWAWVSLFTVWFSDVYIRHLALNPDLTHWFGVIPV